MAEPIHVKNKEMLNVIQHRPDEMVYVEDTKSYYKFINGKWEKLQIKSTSSVPLYEINKAAMQNEKPLTPEEVEEKKALVNDWAKGNSNCKYFMLLCREENYYTVFARAPEPECKNLAEGLFDCLENFGQVLDINKINLKRVEIWVKKGDSILVMYLFPYDKGVVTIGD